MKRIFFLIFFVLIFQNALAEEQKLSEVYEYRLLERVKNVFSLEVPKEKIEHPVCATPIFLEINANKHRFSAKTAQLLKPYIARPDFGANQEDTYNTPSGHFKIHYTRTGEDAVFHPDEDKSPMDGVPDYVNRCSDILDSVWAKEVDGLGYDPPLKDDWYQPNGGDEKYDVYLKNMRSDYYGYTQSDTLLPGSLSSTSYMVVRNEYKVCQGHDDNLDCLRATAAHEFFHAIQMRYDASEFEFDNPDDKNTFKPYWMEMSATWMEDIVYDAINDYLNYLRYFFDYPWLSLKTFSNEPSDPPKYYHAYGSCVWPIFLSERFDVDIIKDIWKECAKVPGPNVISCQGECPGGKSATDKALEARGSTFEDAFREFTVWNYFTSDRVRTQLFYSEGDKFPKVKVDSLQYHTVYPVSMFSPLLTRPENLGSNYVVFVPDPDMKEGGIRIDFDGHSGDYIYKVSAVGYNPLVLEPFENSFLLNPYTQTGMAEVYNWSTYTEVLMIPAVIKRSPDMSWLYEYGADYDSSLHGESPLPPEDHILQNYPNPFVIESESDRTYFPFVLSSPSRVRIDILTMSGERIKTITPKYDPKLAIGEYVDENLAMPWDGKNEKGEYVSSGMYLYKFRTDRATVIKKMVVIR